MILAVDSVMFVPRLIAQTKEINSWCFCVEKDRNRHPSARISPPTTARSLGDFRLQMATIKGHRNRHIPKLPLPIHTEMKRK